MTILDFIKSQPEEVQEEIAECISNDTFKLIEKDNELIGFFCWLIKFKNRKKHIYIFNTFIKPEFRNKTNLLFMREYIRDYFKKDYEFVYWHNNKKNRFEYHK